MTIFKTLLKVVKANKGILILYSVLLIVFGTLNMQTSDNNMNFESTKPNIYIVNKDTNNKVTNSFIEYLKDNTNIKDIKEDNDAIDDALFYRDISYVIYINEDFGNNLLSNNKELLEIKSNNTAESSMSQMIVDKYINTFNIYKQIYINDIDKIINSTKESLKINSNIKIESKLDTTELSNATYYFNFTNYSLIAGCVYVICIIISSFRAEPIRKRTIISSINYKKLNMELLLSSGLFGLSLWFIYTIVGIIIVGKVMLSIHGLLYILNSLLFAVCAITMAFLIANIISNKNALGGLINVIALGSSFLCGSFVPMDMLPNTVLKVAQILPSYWFIKNNEIIKTLETINIKNLKPIINNALIIIIFIIVFIIITNIISKRKRKIN